MEINEAEIIKNCQAGKLDGFALLYDAYFEKIYDHVFYRTMHKETAEDLTGQIFFQALDNINKFDNSPGRFSSWLYRIAGNKVIDHYRGKKNDESLEMNSGLVAQSDLEENVGNSILLDEVRKYMDKMKPLQKEILILRLWEGKTHKEIAQILSISEDNSKLILSRGLARLKKDLAILAAVILIIACSILWN